MAATNSGESVPSSAMNTSASQNNSNETSDRRNRVMVGELPGDFLRPATHPLTQEQEDERIARMLQHQHQGGQGHMANMAQANLAGRLSISVVQAKLIKNYGLTKMDPYCRVRIGHTVFETPTAYNGAKAPRWNKTVTTYLPQGVDSMYIEIFDERSFTMDDRIAWAHVKIPSTVMNGETVDEWYNLSGRQGDDKEGNMNLVLSLTPPTEAQFPYPQAAYPSPVPGMPMMMPQVPMYLPAPQQMVGQAPTYPGPQHPPQPSQPPPITDQDVQQVKDMFPAMEDDVVRSVLEVNRGNKDATINALLSMSAD